MFPSTSSRETSGEKQNYLVSRGTRRYVLCYIFRFFPSTIAAKHRERATTAELYPSRDTFKFDQGHLTKNQPITVLVLLSESLLYNNGEYLPRRSLGKYFPESNIYDVIHMNRT